MEEPTQLDILDLEIISIFRDKIEASYFRQKSLIPSSIPPDFSSSIQRRMASCCNTISKRLVKHTQMRKPNIAKPCSLLLSPKAYHEQREPEDVKLQQENAEKGKDLAGVVRAIISRSKETAERLMEQVKSMDNYTHGQPEEPTLDFHSHLKRQNDILEYERDIKLKYVAMLKAAKEIDTGSVVVHDLDYAVEECLRKTREV